MLRALEGGCFFFLLGWINYSIWILLYTLPRFALRYTYFLGNTLQVWSMSRSARKLKVFGTVLHELSNFPALARILMHQQVLRYCPVSQP